MNATSVLQANPYLLESRQPTVIAVCGLFIALGTFAVITRAAAKWTCQIPWGWDDVFILLGYICTVAVAAVAICFVIYGGVGLHLIYVFLTAPQKIVELLKYARVLPFPYLAAVVFPKLAIIHLYLSIFVQRLFRQICWIVVAIMIVNWIGGTIANALICVPYDHEWNPSPDGSGYCLRVNPYYRWVSFANIITDVVIIILPIQYIWKIKLSLATRIGILFTFLLGGIGLLSSILRFVGFSDADLDSGDSTWTGVTPIIWTVAEPGSYLIAACLPVCRPLVKRLYNGIVHRITTLRSGRSHLIADDRRGLRTNSEAASNRRAEADSLKMDDLPSGREVPPVPRIAKDIHVAATNAAEIRDL